MPQVIAVGIFAGDLMKSIVMSVFDGKTGKCSLNLSVLKGLINGLISVSE